MKRLTGFINGFIACLLMVYSFIIFVIYKWAKAEDICGFEIKQRYSTYRPKYKCPVRYSYAPPTCKSYSDAADDADVRIGKIKFNSEEDAKWAKNWLIEQIESYKYVSAFDFLSHNKGSSARYADHKYGWSDANLEEIESLEPNRLNDYWYLDLPPVSYIGKRR